MLQILIQLLIIIPFFGFIISLLIPRKLERTISITAIITVSTHSLLFILLFIYWIYIGNSIIEIKEMETYKSKTFDYFIDIYFDKITAVYSLVGSVLMFTVTVFSHFYLHREAGFKRFFTIILLFYLGYNIVIFSGNMETLFIGWEIVGVCSFLLIAFYRDRYLPVKNAIKVFSLFNLGDVCLILVMWMSHHLWHHNITFSELHDSIYVHAYLRHHHSYGIFIALMILIAAVVKSAQLPFSSWLPRAMEGPTSSSAIFYGSLSLHLGVFLLLRTYPFWESLLGIKVSIITIGLFTSVIATGIAKVQSTVKTQIAYSSIAQIGLMFIEVAFGFESLVLIHFSGNAFFRTYQLLVSPSVLGYRIHNMFFNFKITNFSSKKPFFKTLNNSFYILCLKEWNLDLYINKLLWNPFKFIGNKAQILNARPFMGLLLLIYALGIISFNYQKLIPVSIYKLLPVFYAFLSLLIVLKAFTKRGDAIWSWMLILSSHFFIALSVSLNDTFNFNETIIFMSGAIISAITGYICLVKIKKIDNDINLNKFHGYNYEKPTIAIIFLLACLGLLGIPITPSFIGVDLMYTHIFEEQYILILLISLSFVFIELSVLRVYARIFLGPHKKSFHPIAYKSS